MKLYLITDDNMTYYCDEYSDDFAITEDYDKAVAVADKMQGIITEIDTEKCDEILKNDNAFKVILRAKTGDVLNVTRINANNFLKTDHFSMFNHIPSFIIERHTETAEQAIELAKQQYLKIKAEANNG